MSAVETPVTEEGPAPDAAASASGSEGTPAPAPAPASALGRLVLLAAVVVAVGALAVLTGQGDLALVVVCLIVMIMVHELGHFMAAKHGGMKVTEYFLGFGPKVWSVQKGETEYGIKALPLGGYVKIPGMTNLDIVDPADEDRAYRSRPFRARLLVAVAGSAMHFLMAFVLLWTLLVFVGHPAQDRTSFSAVSTLAGRPGPAQKAGIRPGDIAVSIDGRAVAGDSSVLVDAIRQHPGTALTLVVQRNGSLKTLSVTPIDGRTIHQTGVSPGPGNTPFGLIGVTLGAPTVRSNPISAVGQDVIDLGRYSWASVVGVAHLFSPSATVQRFSQVTSAKAAQQASANGTRVQSIVGAVQTAQEAAHAGIADLLLVLISINLFVGIFNLFPMLPLDGGHVAIAVYERIRSTKRRGSYHADVRRLLPFTWAMLAFLGVLFATSLLTDVLHPMANPFG